MGKKQNGGTWLHPISSVEKFIQKEMQPQAQAQAQAPFMKLMQPPTGGNIDILSGILHSLNTNPYLIGILMLLLNLGGRFLSFELTKKQEAFLQQAWLRPFIFFTVIFIATRNLAVAFWVTLFFFFVIWVVANENSPFCLIPSWRNKSTDEPARVYETNVQVLQKLNEVHVPYGPHLEEPASVPTDQEVQGVYAAPNESNTN